MRLWSIHPKYLDAKGLVALWREGLLAKKVLENKTKGYKNHPQLIRFKNCKNPRKYINTYLHYICDEADERGYLFNRLKLNPRPRAFQKILVKKGQAEYEWEHLLSKLKDRSEKDFEKANNIRRPRLHPLFIKTSGGIEAWEVVK